MAFNLDDYEPVESRLAKFHEDHAEGRVLTVIEHHGQGEWIVRAEVYTDRADARPAATGHAHEVTGDGMVNKTSALENCETSAIGRALANLGYAAKRASREEMEKVERQKVDHANALDQVQALLDTCESKGLEVDAGKALAHAGQSLAHAQQTVRTLTKRLQEGAAA